MLLNKDMKLGSLRGLLWTEVGLESMHLLELRIRNRALRADADDQTLEALGFKNNAQVVVSKVLGLPPGEDQNGVNEKNKQFVGDLLFGQTPNGGSTMPAAAVAGGGGSSNQAAGGGGASSSSAAGSSGGTSSAAGSGTSSANNSSGNSTGGGGSNANPTNTSSSGSSSKSEKSSVKGKSKGHGKGPTKRGSAAATAKDQAAEAEIQPVSIIDTFRIKGGYQILGE